MLLSIPLILVPFLTGPLQGRQSEGAAIATNVCEQTASFALKAKMHEIQDDYNVALGICLNYSNPGQRAACLEEARAALAEGKELALEQYDERLDLCAVLGQGAYDPAIVPSQFTTAITNPYFPLVPGTTYTFRAVTSEGTEIDVFEVTHGIRNIQGVDCVIVHDTVELNGSLIEDTLDYHAQDLAGNVWYFGEDSAQLENGVVVGVEGSWIAGVDGAKAGLVMEASPKKNDWYRQEFSLANAEDAATVADLHAAVVVPYGPFSNCVRTREVTPLEPDQEAAKFYAAGIGNVLSVDLETNERSELIGITFVP